MVQEFFVEFANSAITNYGDINSRIFHAKTFADYADELYESTPRTRDIFEIASDMNDYTLHIS